MKNNIETILEELYLIDISLKERENELKSIILKIIETKPDIKINKDFKEKLQQELLSKITQIKVNNYWVNKKLSFFQIFWYIFWTVWLACFWFIIFQNNFKNVLDINPIPDKKIEKWALTWIPQSNTFSVAKEEVIWNEMTRWAPKIESSAMMADMFTEYIQEEYHFTFIGELNIELDWTVPTFKKDSGENIYFSKRNLEIETNNKNILTVALKWWKDWFISMPESQKKKIIDVKLQNPKLGYTNVYHLINGQNKEYFVPCIIFEVIKDKTPNNFYQNEVIVPLIKEIYIYDENGSIIWISQ